ncbi:hypothetical protein [Noviherbaspirillum suwonense]|uniref:Uncharacterized protein n=1 Tax=Noviherbaspirillum suwonense TaxID=1224511 RepID=A0ABY1QIQ0_9BURK|nr:hypothetical protein [Noviherbaspirillum suwonense]SMP72097.1 hypothetical protein SAMN06295970_117137 [Noviherbaspirillum suwonense]
MPPHPAVPDGVDQTHDIPPAVAPIPVAPAVPAPVPNPPPAPPAAPRRGRTVGMAAVVTLIAVTLARAFGAPSWLFVVAAAAALALIASGFSLINSRLRNTSFILFIIAALALPFARAPVAALERGIFIAALLISVTSSVMLIARCAMQSHRIGFIGAGLRERQGSRRYLSFALASQFFSGILGLAGANLMYIMAAPSTEGKSEGRTETVVAVGRGFAAASCWSPVFGNMAILLALYPTLSWLEVFPVGLALGQVTIVVGALMNLAALSRLPAPQSPPAILTPMSTLLRSSLPLMISLLTLLALIMTASWLLHIVISAAIVLLAPFVSLLFNAATGRAGHRVADGVAGLGRAMENFGALASEALLFMAAGCAGSVLADAIPTPWIAAIGAALSGHQFLGLSFLVAAIIGTSLAGVHPVLSAVFLASSLPPPVLGLPPITHMAAILAGWGLSANMTPFSVISLTASRYAGIGPGEISFGRNWRFALTNAVVICAALAAFAWMLRA